MLFEDIPPLTQAVSGRLMGYPEGYREARSLLLLRWLNQEWGKYKSDPREAVWRMFSLYHRELEYGWVRLWLRAGKLRKTVREIVTCAREAPAPWMYPFLAHCMLHEVSSGYSHQPLCYDEQIDWNMLVTLPHGVTHDTDLRRYVPAGLHRLLKGGDARQPRAATLSALYWSQVSLLREPHVGQSKIEAFCSTLASKGFKPDEYGVLYVAARKGRVYD